MSGEGTKEAAKKGKSGRRWMSGTGGFGEKRQNSPETG